MSQTCEKSTCNTPPNPAILFPNLPSLKEIPTRDFWVTIWTVPPTFFCKPCTDSNKRKRCLQRKDANYSYCSQISPFLLLIAAVNRFWLMTVNKSTRLIKKLELKSWYCWRKRNRFFELAYQGPSNMISSQCFKILALYQTTLI